MRVVERERKRHRPSRVNVNGRLRCRGLCETHLGLFCIFRWDFIHREVMRRTMEQNSWNLCRSMTKSNKNRLPTLTKLNQRNEEDNTIRSDRIQLSHIWLISILKRHDQWLTYDYTKPSIFPTAVADILLYLLINLSFGVHAHSFQFRIVNNCTKWVHMPGPCLVKRVLVKVKEQHSLKENIKRKNKAPSTLCLLVTWPVITSSNKFIWQIRLHLVW